MHNSASLKMWDYNNNNISKIFKISKMDVPAKENTKLLKAQLSECFENLYYSNKNAPQAYIEF